MNTISRCFYASLITLVAVACNVPSAQTSGSPSSPTSSPVPANPVPANPVTETPVETPESTAPSAAPIVYGGPITITKGGTYTGNWQSLDPNVPAVSIRTTEPIIIQNCNVRGKGLRITARFNDDDAQTGISVTVRGCRGYGLDPGIRGQARGLFFLAVYPKTVVIENNYLEQTRGINLIGDNTFGNVKTLKILRNRARNIDGRTSDGSRCKTGFVTNNGNCGAGFVQFNGFLRNPGLEIAWNEIINTPFKSDVEDNINIYNSSGTAQSPILIHDNYVQGAYPANPLTDPSTGSGINAGDGDTEADADHSTAFVRAYRNQVVSTANVGMFIAAGSNIELFENRVVSSGRLPDGRLIKNHFTGMYVWDCCYQHVPRGIFSNNLAYNNVIGCAWINEAGQAIRNDTKFDDCAKNPNGSSRCTGNTILPGAITPETERYEYRLWLEKVRTQKVKVGP
jgi:hypothetical protein